MGILLRNWHLKLGALALATVLYTGLVFSGSFTVETEAGVLVEGLNQPDGTVLLGAFLGTVDVRYRASPEAVGAIDPSSFAASVDLSAYDLARPAEPQSLPVQVRSLVPGVTVESVNPEQVTVVLDEVATKPIPVRVEIGELPAGLETGREQVSDDEVIARGASSLIARVDHAVASVRIDPSGINVTGPVVLRAVGVDGEEVEPIELTPDTVTIEVEVRQVETTRTVPVRPDVRGTPASGFALTSVSVEPAAVTIQGIPDVLEGVNEIPTEAISIAGASAEQEISASLVVPEGARLLGNADATVTVTVTIVPSLASRTFVVGVACVGAGENACLPSVTSASVTLSGPAAALGALTAAQVTPF